MLKNKIKILNYNGKFKILKIWPSNQKSTKEKEKLLTI